MSGYRLSKRAGQDLIDSCAYTLEQSSLAQAENYAHGITSCFEMIRVSGKRPTALGKAFAATNMKAMSYFIPRTGTSFLSWPSFTAICVPIYNSEPPANDRGKRAQPKVRRDLPCNPPNRKPPDV